MEPTFKQTYEDLKFLWENIDNENVRHDENHHMMLLLDLIIELANQLDQCVLFPESADYEIPNFLPQK